MDRLAYVNFTFSIDNINAETKRNHEFDKTMKVVKSVKNSRCFVQRQLAVPHSSVVQVGGASPIGGDATGTMIVAICQMKLDAVSSLRI